MTIAVVFPMSEETLPSKRGHAEDCPGCEWEAYGFKADDLRYIGTPPPHRPAVAPDTPKPTLHRWAAVLFGAVCGFAGVAEYSHLIGTAGEISALVVFTGVWVNHLRHDSPRPKCPWCTRKEINSYPERLAQWKLEQSRASMELEANDAQQPCRLCGLIDCRQHTEKPT